MLARRTPNSRWLLIAGAALVAVLAVVSVGVGAFEISWASLLHGEEGGLDTLVLLASRAPRTIAVLLVGASMSVAGLLMQLLLRNKFVAPSTAGTIEAASLGILVSLIFMPAAPVLTKMLVASAFALGGTALLMAIVRRVPLRSPLIVPLLGLMLGAVIGSVSTFIAYRYDLLQSLAGWTTGDFSRVLRGRYELLWVAAALGIIAYLTADRFTVLGMGETFTKNLGVNYARTTLLGLVIVALVTAVNVVTVGAVPFIGLVVPNVVSLLVGDNVRSALPWVALFGAGFVLVCDLLGRTLRYPYEIPVGTVIGVVGAALFLFLLFRRSARVG